MSVFRKNLITNDWVIFAPNRASRPRELGSHEEDNRDILAQRPSRKETCPFCPGNELHSEPALLTLEGPTGWQVRVLPNKYSSVDRNVHPDKRSEGLRKEVEGFGIHDVIIDHPRHNLTLALMEPTDIERLLEAYVLRYRELERDSQVRHVVVFKNQGIKAGGSLEHPHSQIYGLPVIPFETAIRLREMERYFDFHDRCLLCDIVADERLQKVRIVYESECFLALLPYADLSPYHLWVVPKRHSPSFSLLQDKERKDLAQALKVVFGKLFTLLHNPDFNFVVQSLVRHDREGEYFHWYFSVIPHVKHKGGLEYAGGLYVNPVLPESAAEELRNAELPANIEP